MGITFLLLKPLPKQLLFSPYYTGLPLGRNTRSDHPQLHSVSQWSSAGGVVLAPGNLCNDVDITGFPLESGVMLLAASK